MEERRAGRNELGKGVVGKRENKKERLKASSMKEEMKGRERMERDVRKRAEKCGRKV
jgi:hypothetical protein